MAHDVDLDLPTHEPKAIGPDDYQKFPSDDPILGQNLDQKLPAFENDKRPPPECDQGLTEPEQGALCGLPENVNVGNSAIPAHVIAYILETVEWDAVAGCMKQTGGAPNFQGGRISLCTCRPDIRTWEKQWPRVWIAGFANKKTTFQYLKHHQSSVAPGIDPAKLRVLFYLMQVDFAAASHLDLWNASAYLSVRAAKNARFNKFGDLYEPNLSASSWPYCADCYHHPKGNVHYPDSWRIDIGGTKNGIHPSLLVGEPGRSFIWTGMKHGYISDSIFAHHKRFCPLADFYKALQMV